VGTSKAQTLAVIPGPSNRLAVIRDASELESARQLAIFRMQGGELREEQALPADPGALALAVGDLDGDGIADLATTSFAAETDQPAVRVYLGHADGSFALAAERATGPDQFLIGIFELAPHAPELAIANATSIDRYRWIAGRLAPAGTIRRQPLVRQLHILDVDGDGKPDLVFEHRDTDGLTVIRNAGGGRLGAPVTFQVCDGMRLVGVLDFDGDGELDAIVACGKHENGSTSTVAGGPIVLVSHLADPHRQIVKLSVEAEQIAVGDLTGDRAVDLFAATENADGSSRVALYRGTGRGKVEPVGTGEWASDLHEITVADLDGDGRSDVLALEFLKSTEHLVMWRGVRCAR
jgi:hypothetical protein